ncbi:MAG: bifunctional oligoribonuclease/PAP phosphatase NrnA [Muribaculaceae bacterium]|nr:bifunctional oligoribonuclease/PAP phosphatase NrnA [Muribaculaceae bacterium]
MVIEQIDSSIKNSKNILLVSHINPDGDTLGSMCGTYSFIKDNYKKKCDMVCVSEIPVTYNFIPYITEVKNITEMDRSREYDLVITLDVAAPDRCTDAQILLEKAKQTINIDHHQTNPNYADINLVKPEASATAEVLTDLFTQTGLKISNETAICLYVGILTDTGSFKFSNTTANTLVCASKLLALGVNPAEIYQKCYESQSKDMVLFQSYCINKAQFTNDDKIAYTTVFKKDLEKFNNKGEDFTDGLTEKLRAIRTTEIAFVVKEVSAGASKVSMRSKEKDIAQVCSAFGGGGHKLAAGALIKANPDKTIKMILNEIKNKGLC